MTLDFMPELFEKEATKPTRYIDIEMSVHEAMAMAAALKLAANIPSEMPANWPARDIMTSAEWHIYRQIVAESVDIISSFGFNNVKPEFWDSGSCYVEFVPKKYDGTLYDELIRARFRISDHDSPYGVNSWNNGELFMMFTINGYQVDTIEGVLNTLSNICRDIMMGDFSKLPRA